MYLPCFAGFPFSCLLPPLLPPKKFKPYLIFTYEVSALNRVEMLMLETLHENILTSNAKQNPWFHFHF